MAIIDPHKVFANGENVDLAQLSLYAELKVTKRNRLSNGTNSGGEPIVINFLGANSDGVFTTNFTDNAENFGITKIDYRITSSYVPQVDIEFMDVRGQSLYNDNVNSKYKVIFDMPPPIFELTLKGYYGQSVTYRLHLLHSNANFTSDGNTVLKASFVGMTFAPLADLLFDYLEVAPYLTPNSEIQDGDVNTTVELRTKAKVLVTELKTATQKDVQYLQDKSVELENLKTYQNKDYVKDFIDNINATRGVDQGQNNQVVASRKGEIVTIGFKWFGANLQEWADEDSYEILKNKLDDAKKFFSTIDGMQHIIGNIPTTTDDLTKPDNLNENQYIKILTINFTNVNNKLSDARNNLSNQIALKQDDTKANIATIINKDIKGGANLRNVLRILLTDAKRFVNELKKVVDNVSTKRKGDNTTTNGEAYKYPFPKYYIYKPVGSSNRLSRVLSIPQNQDWDEVQFVNRYINAKMQVASYEKQNSATFDPNNASNNTWVPINPFDSIFSSVGFNPYTNVSKNDLMEVIVQRAAVINNATFEFTDNNISNILDLLKIYGKLEAYNIINTLKNNPIMMNYLIDQITPTTFNFADASTIFNANIKAGDSQDTADHATNTVVYEGGQMIQLKSKEDFNAIGGVPTERTPLPGSDAVTNGINDLMNSLEKNFFTRTVSGDDKLNFCQYNIPFFKDNTLRDSDGAFNNSSDYFTNSDIFLFGSPLVPSDFTDPDTFLLKICKNNPHGRCYTPFEFTKFQQLGALHEIPYFVLAYWGWFVSNSNSLTADEKVLWATIPQKMQDILADKYADYKSLFNAQSANIQSYLTNIGGYFKAATIGITPKSDFYKSPFMIKFTESFYLVLGETKVFTKDPNKVINFSASKSNLINAYYTTLRNELKVNKPDISKNQADEQKKIDSKVRDNDLRTELYYGFKTFVDRWLLDNTAVDFDKLFDIDQAFLLVDRAFNDIGNDVQMDLEPLYSTDTSVDTSLYTLLLNLLSKNNMEFFSLPTYITYKDSGLLWNEQNLTKIFGTFNSLSIDTNPKFICMYVGGTSSQLDMPKITDDATSHDNDSGTIDSLNGDNITDLSGNDFVQAFSIQFGTQNQSFFKNIELDQAEFKETNESIKLLDKIASSGEAPGQSTEIKTNNLFNVYQQRSYTATVTAMGNMMIQPTMYFQLENIAMWKGTYLIIEVNHSMTPNGMETKFKGVRVPKYMKPFVDDYTIIANIDLGTPVGSSTTLGTSSVSGGRGVSRSEVKTIKDSLTHIGTNNTTKLSAKEKALLDVISYTEGTLGQGQNGYDVLYTNKKIQAWNDNYKLGHGGDAWKNTSNGITSTAAGRYQFLYDTWLGYSTGDGAAQGDPNNKPFSLTNQDLTGVRLIKEKRLNQYGLNIESINHDNFIKYIDVLALEWASFPFYGTIKVKSKSPSWSVGKGFYDGQGGRFTVDELWIVYSLALKKYTEGVNTDLDAALNGLLASTVTPAQAAHIAQLHPSVQSKFTDLVSQIQSQTGYLVDIQSSFRTYEAAIRLKEQDNRNAEPGTSLHEYGLAFDINLKKGSETLVKGSSKTAWNSTGVVAIAKNLGFRWGGEFTGYEDNVHFEATNNGVPYHGITLLQKAQQLYGANLKSSDLRKISIT